MNRAMGRLDFAIDHNKIFCEICAEGDLKKVKAYYGTNGAQIHWRCDALIVACQNNLLDIAKWLYFLKKFDFDRHMDLLFKHACSNGHLDIAQWIYVEKKINICDVENAFALACAHGHLNTTQWLHSLRADIHTENDYAFSRACANGQLRVARWLYSLGEIDIHADYENAFALACGGGYLNVAQWLYSLGEVNVHDDDNNAFRSACKNNFLNVAQWIYSINRNSISVRIFNECLARIKINNIAMLEFLLDGGADVCSNDDKFLQSLNLWANKLAVYLLVLQYCSEDEYCFFDADVIAGLLNRPKSARKV